MILVTGATGHIGNVLVRELLELGERVRALVRQAGTPAALAGLGVECWQGDVLDPASLEGAMRGVKVVYHLAARISLAVGADPETETVNLQGTLNVLETARRAGVGRLVYASSIYALRQPAEGGTIDESQPFDPQACRGAYDRSKARASLAVQAAAARDLDAVLVCPTAVVGPYDFHESEAGRAIRLYLAPGIKFLVEGAYDFVDVRDTAQGCLLAAERGRRGETYILGGERMSVTDMTRTIWQAAGCSYPSLQVPVRLAYGVADLMPFFYRLTGMQPLFTRYSLDAIRSNSRISHARAERELGFIPRPAAQAVTDAVRWFLERELAESAFSDPIPDAAA